MNNRFYAVLWFTAVVVAITGVVAIGVRYTPVGWWLLAGGGSVLTAFAFRSAWQTTQSRVAWPVGGMYVLVTSALLSYVALLAVIGVPWGEIPLWGRVAILVTGAQALFLAVGVRVTGIPFVERVVVPAAGHLLLFAGSVLIVGVLLFGVPWVVTYAVALIYATGFSALALHTFWLGRHADEVVPPRPFTVHRYWEQVLIVALIAGLVSVALASITLRANVSIDLFPDISQARVASIVATIAAIIAIATLVPPAVPVAPLRRLTGPISTHSMDSRSCWSQQRNPRIGRWQSRKSIENGIQIASASSKERLARKRAISTSPGNTSTHPTSCSSMQTRPSTRPSSPEDWTYWRILRRSVSSRVGKSSATRTTAG